MLSVTHHKIRWRRRPATNPQAARRWPKPALRQRFPLVSSTRSRRLLEHQLPQRCGLGRLHQPRHHHPGCFERNFGRQLVADPGPRGAGHAARRQLHHPRVHVRVGAHPGGPAKPRWRVGRGGAGHPGGQIVSATRLDDGGPGGEPGGCHIRRGWLDQCRPNRAGGRAGRHARHPRHADGRWAGLRTWAPIRIPRDGHAASAGRRD